MSNRTVNAFLNKNKTHNFHVPVPSHSESLTFSKSVTPLLYSFEVPGNRKREREGERGKERETICQLPQRSMAPAARLNMLPTMT